MVSMVINGGFCIRRKVSRKINNRKERLLENMDQLIFTESGDFLLELEGGRR